MPRGRILVDLHPVLQRESKPTRLYSGILELPFISEELSDNALGRFFNMTP